MDTVPQAESEYVAASLAAENSQESEDLGQISAPPTEVNQTNEAYIAASLAAELAGSQEDDGGLAAVATTNENYIIAANQASTSEVDLLTPLG